MREDPRHDWASSIERLGWILVLVILGMAWVNGPAVSTDQRVIRWGMVLAAAGVVIGIRCGRMIARRCRRDVEPDGESESSPGVIAASDGDHE